MRWRKQVTSMRTDPRVKRLIRKYGSDGWTVYTVILDSIGEGMDPISQIIPYLQETSEEITEDFKIDSRRVEEIVFFCGNQGLLDVSSNGAIFCFKIYKYADEYFTKSQKNKEDYAERNKEVIKTYKQYGRKAAIEKILEYNPMHINVLRAVAIDSGVAPELLQSYSGVGTDLLRQEREIDKIDKRDQTPDNDLPEAFDSTPPKRNYSTEYETLRTLWNSKSCLPSERRTVANIGQAMKQIMTNMEPFTLDEMRGAIEAYAAIPDDKRLYRSFKNFIAGDGLHNYKSDPKPDQTINLLPHEDYHDIVDRFYEQHK